MAECICHYNDDLLPVRAGCEAQHHRVISTTGALRDEAAKRIESLRAALREAEARLERALKVLGEVARCQPIGPMERQIWYEVYKIIDAEADWFVARRALAESGEPRQLTEADYEGIRRGVKELREGKTRPWKDIKTEAGVAEPEREGAE